MPYKDRVSISCRRETRDRLEQAIVNHPRLEHITTWERFFWHITNRLESQTKYHNEQKEKKKQDDLGD